MANDWTREEVEATVSDYLDMLASELRGEPFNKAKHNRNLRNILVRRSKGAVEKKHQNISAVLIELGYPYIDGYKPLPNYQTLLAEIVADRLAEASSLHRAAQAIVERTQIPEPAARNLEEMLVSPPVREEARELMRETATEVRSFARRNYLQIESRNRALGVAGERLILEFERERLSRAGRTDLAGRIEHVSDSRGDYLGFDILSFETNERERFIEVKTTQFGELTPFFASKNEVEVSEENKRQYQLYRLFNFVRDPKLYILPGSLRETCVLDPSQYSALPQ